MARKSNNKKEKGTIRKKKEQTEYQRERDRMKKSSKRKNGRVVTH